MEDFYCGNESAPILESDTLKGTIAAVAVAIQMEGILTGVNPREMLMNKCRVKLPDHIQNSWKTVDFFSTCSVKLISLDGEELGNCNEVKLIKGVTYDA